MPSKNKRIAKILNKEEFGKPSAKEHAPKHTPVHSAKTKSQTKTKKLTYSQQEYQKARAKVLKNRGKKRAPRKKIDYKKYAIWASILLVAVILWKLFDIPQIFLNLLQLNPAIWEIYRAIQAEVSSRTLLGLLYASFFGSLFFLSLPVEAIFIYYLGLNYYVVQVVTIVMIGNLLGMIFNYTIGWLIGERVIQYFMKDNYDKFKKKLDRAGAFIILIGNIIPFPIEPFAVFLGAVRYKFRNFILYTLIGKIIKFILLSLGYIYFIKYAAPYLGTVSVDWFADTIRDVFHFW